MASSCLISSKAITPARRRPSPPPLVPQSKEEGLGYSPRVHHPKQGLRIEAAEDIDDWQVVVQHRRAGHATVLHHPQTGLRVVGDPQRQSKPLE